MSDVHAAAPAQAPATERPASATPAVSAAVGCIAAFAALWAVRDWSAAPYQRALAVMACVGGAVLVADRWCGVGGAPGAPRPREEETPHVVAGRVGRKLLGLYATLGAVGAAYALFPEYAGKFYEPVWAAVRLLAPWFVVISPVYVWMVDRRQEQPEDVYAAIGAWLVRRRPVDDLAALGVHARGWLVKGFFLPLMFVYATRDLGTWIARVDGATPQRFMQVYDLLYGTGYLLDLVFTCVGYALTLRLTDTQQRSVEPTLLGWVACLVCYQPFWGVLGDRYFAYDTDGIVWGPRFAGTPWLQVAWGSAILACVGVYTWATVSFGVRFSNLSHRGIITSGPYRWLKHPAYVSKNVSWWLIAVPFLHAGSPWTAVRSCLLLLAVNGIYALRAWTEERHLAQDPTYRAYQDWIAEHGLVARLRKGWTRSSPAGTP